MGSLGDVLRGTEQRGKTSKIHVLVIRPTPRSLPDKAVQRVRACDEDIEILTTFTYLGSVICNNGVSPLCYPLVDLTHCKGLA